MDTTLNTLAKIIQSSWTSQDVSADAGDDSSPDFANMLLQALEQEFPSTPLPGRSAPAPELSSVSAQSLLSALSGGQAGAPGRPDRQALEELAQQTAQKYGVDPQLVQSVIRVESNFDPSAVSSQGAVGLMQLMPKTAAALGVTDALDPRQNLDGGVRYLGQMLYRYQNNVSLALAAYNAGPGAVDRSGGIPDYAETQAYVKKVLGRGLGEGEA